MYYNRQTQPETHDTPYPEGVLERKNLSTGEVQALNETECARGGIALAGDYIIFQASISESAEAKSYPREHWFVPKTGGQAMKIEI